MIDNPKETALLGSAVESPTDGGASPSGAHGEHCTPVRQRKWQRVLAAFLRGEAHHRFTAERALHDHTLHSTVCGLEHRGVRILREGISIPGFGGAPTRIKLYRLDPASRTRAAELLQEAA